MRTTAYLASLFAIVSSSSLYGQSPTVGTLDESQQKKTKALNPEYLLYSPKEDREHFPLVIYLHGSGGVGKDIRRIKGQVSGLVRGIERFAKTSCYVVAPQCLGKTSKGLGWIPDDLNILLAHLKATKKIDAARIYLTGNSMGGYGAWVWGGRNPEHFAAIAPISGGLGSRGPKDVTPDLEKWASQLAKVPVHAFVGAKDRVVPPERSERMIDAIKKAGGKEAKIKIYPDERHNARRIVFSNAEFYGWMFSKQRVIEKPSAVSNSEVESPSKVVEPTGRSERQTCR